MSTADTAFRDNLVRHARVYVRRGLALTPILPKGKRPYLKAWGKHPFRTVEQIERHWASHPDDNVGLILGALSGVCDIECDTDQGRDALEGLLTPEQKQTPTYTSGKPRMCHRSFQLPELPERLAGSNVIAADGIEIRLGLDGQTQSVLPPSIHPTGRVYAWVRNLGPWQVDPQPFPVDVLEYVEERIAIREEGCGTIQVYRTETVSNETVSNVIALPAGDRPGDIYNQLARWEDVLDGWKKCGTKGSLTLWKHPASESGAHSAATGWQTAAGNDVLVVYSNRTKFGTVLGKDGTCYTKFEAYAILKHGGDRTKAAAMLAEQGYKPAELKNLDEIVYRIVQGSAV